MNEDPETPSLARIIDGLIRTIINGQPDIERTWLSSAHLIMRYLEPLETLDEECERQFAQEWWQQWQ